MRAVADFRGGKTKPIDGKMPSPLTDETGATQNKANSANDRSDVTYLLGETYRERLRLEA
jgi:hypothetical protein